MDVNRKIAYLKIHLQHSECCSKLFCAALKVHLDCVSSKMMKWFRQHCRWQPQSVKNQHAAVSTTNNIPTY